MSDTKRMEFINAEPIEVEEEVECCEPCPYDIRCPKCKVYWDRVVAEGLYVRDSGWTQEALKVAAKY